MKGLCRFFDKDLSVIVVHLFGYFLFSFNESRCFTSITVNGFIFFNTDDL